jgi:thiol:disulfide interchange protein/DsbC/DsbD-like thiol-disulfide interchange protein
MSRLRLALWAAAVILSADAAWAQPQLNDILTGRPLGGQGTAEAAGDTPDSIVTVSASFSPTTGGDVALAVTAKIQAGWHIYALTQKPVQAIPTTITLVESSDYRVLGQFRPTLPPHVVQKEGAVFEQHEGEVTWQAPVRLAAGVDPAKVTITGKARIQACSEVSCLQPQAFSFAARMAAPAAAPAAVAAHSDPNGHITFTGRLVPQSVAPGGTARLVIEAAPAEGWHIYELAGSDQGALGNKPTLIVLTDTSGFPFSRTVADRQAVEGEPLLPGEPAQRYYENRVTWTTTLKIPAGTKPGEYPIAGTIGYQVCTSRSCDLPRGATFKGTLVVSNAASGRGTSPLAFGEAKYGEAARLAETHGNRRADLEPSAGADSTQRADLGALLLFVGAGLLGGFILNFMPCVLPVIGLKILSFAEQAGRSRAQILTLNVWYSLGLMSVFMVLAALASGASLGLTDENLGWGQQFTSTTFNIVLTCIVFVMALSFLGVWEIPIPGFVNTGAANNLATREGPAGAFFKGVMATILSTPCSGPFLGPVFGFTLKQPPAVTFLVFGAMGLGMAAPYLIIGAFPRLIRFLPRPGAWMETFKHLMGFVLLGTIVFLFSFMDPDYFVPTFAMLIGLWAACWWIGQVSFTEPLSVRLKAWAQGAAVAAIVGFASFHWLTPHESLIAWQTFSRGEAQRLSAEGHTVLVDFTADWCLTCKVNLATAIETDDVKQSIEQNKIVPMLADWSKPSDEIKNALASIDRNSIPQLVIYPAGKPQAPIVLSDLITKQQVLAAIAQAGPSKADAKAVAAMP